jgi:hypothetical protein
MKHVRLPFALFLVFLSCMAKDHLVVNGSGALVVVGILLFEGEENPCFHLRILGIMRINQRSDIAAKRRGDSSSAG